MSSKQVLIYAWLGPRLAEHAVPAGERRRPRERVNHDAAVKQRLRDPHTGATGAAATRQCRTGECACTDSTRALVPAKFAVKRKGGMNLIQSPAATVRVPEVQVKRMTKQQTQGTRRTGRDCLRAGLRQLRISRR